MGRATRWLKGLFGIKIKDKDRNEDKGGRSSGGLFHNPATIPPNITPGEAAWLRSFYNESDTEQNKHAIAVAAATAAAADAAVAAAQAAVAVVRLTSQGRGTAVFGGSREKWAAVKIQTVFRGYLARKAHRALKGLVKIQALVRGFLVRKQAAATLHSMQALIRAQATVRARRLTNTQVSMEKYEDTICEYPMSLHSRRLSASLNAFDESPKIVEVDTGSRPNSRSKRAENAVSSPFPCRLSIPDWGEECHFSTAQSTPRFATPAKSSSVCTESYFGDNPSYMAKTQSFKAKLRSQSAPKQRPDGGPKRKLMMESRNSLSGVRMQREAISFKNAVMGKLGSSYDFGTQK